MQNRKRGKSRRMGKDNLLEKKTSWRHFEIFFYLEFKSIN